MSDDNSPFFDSPLFQFILGGVTLTLITFIANQKGRLMIQFAAILSTLPLMDMLPVLFMKDRGAAEDLMWRNALANVGVVIGMGVAFVCMRGRMAKGAAIVVGLLAWALVAFGLASIVDYFHAPTDAQAKHAGSDIASALGANPPE